MYRQVPEAPWEISSSDEVFTDHMDSDVNNEQTASSRPDLSLPRQNGPIEVFCYGNSFTPQHQFVSESRIGHRRQPGRFLDQQPEATSPFPYCPKFADEETRLLTFRSWPKSHLVSAEALAHAGFYYQGSEDLTRCYFCGGCIRNWQCGDDPRDVHAEVLALCGHFDLFYNPDFNISNVGNLLPMENQSGHQPSLEEEEPIEHVPDQDPEGHRSSLDQINS